MFASACSAGPIPDSTPVPTTFPVSPIDEAVATAGSYLDAWAAADYDAMYALLDPTVQASYPMERFAEVHAALAEMALVTEMTATAGEPRTVALAPEPRPADFPAPSPTPAPSPAPSGDAPVADGPSPTADPSDPIEGPVPGLEVEASLELATDRFGDLSLDRSLTLVQGRDAWLVRWAPETLFPELGTDGALRLDRSLGERGSIVGGDGTVWAETRDDGTRVYPQEQLAGQAVGYVSEVTAEDLERLAAEGYRAGDVVGRTGVEGGAEPLLRGTPGWSLVAESSQGESVLYETEASPGADVLITLRPSLQAEAEARLAPYRQAATAVVDPASGDIWAMASAPAFNPNAMTLGTTLAGEALETPSGAQILNKAILGAYPAGSALKPFTLAAALQTGTVTPASRVTCPPTWSYGDFTFRNYENHSLPGRVSLAEAMAFSCNTTYMPLSLAVYERDETALTDLLFEFGFGTLSGIESIVEESGIVPDDEWLAANGRGGYSAFEQIQLSIGQGAFLGTPVQLANAYAAIGNGGTLWRPRIMTAARLPDGTVTKQVEPVVLSEISVSDADLAYVTDTLQAVVTLPSGTGTAAFAGFGIPVAGKSGTAETGTPDPHAWFAAFSPADGPTVAVATVLANIPLGTGGSDAAPLVREVMAAHFAD